MVGPLRKAFYTGQPFQVAPVHLGVRASPPIWDFTIGWSYTFGACPSHFLDCYFLEHSPCPQLEVDVEDVPREVLDPARLRDKPAYMNDHVDWYDKAVGKWEFFLI